MSKENFSYNVRLSLWKILNENDIAISKQKQSDAHGVRQELNVKKSGNETSISVNRNVYLI